MKLLRRISLLLAVFFIALIANSLAEAKATDGVSSTADHEKKIVNIQKINDLVSVDLKDADIEEVFALLSQAFNFEYTLFPEMEKKRITVAFENKPLIESIEKIVRSNYMLEMGADEKITKVYLLNRSDKDLEERNKRIDSFVNKKQLSLDELKTIVTNNVKKEYPKAQLFTVIPHEDIRGNLRSYIFSYYIGPYNSMPSETAVKKELNEAWEQKKIARKNVAEAYKQNDSSAIIEWMEKVQPHDYQLRQTDNYLALEIAADYNSSPVKKYYNGLPYDLAMYPNAMELLERKIGKTENVQFKRTFIMDLVAIGFEFSDTKNNKSYYVDVLNNAVFDGWKERERDKKIKRDNKERDKAIKKQWEDFIGANREGAR